MEGRGIINLMKLGDLSQSLFIVNFSALSTFPKFLKYKSEKAHSEYISQWKHKA